MNILFTCAGRRNYLLKYFREELQGRGKIYAVDMNITAPALQEADASFVVPALTDTDYIPDIIKLCEQENIRLVISLNDVELPLLAKHRKTFKQIGTDLLVSSTEVIDICFDKVKTVDFLQEINLLVPRTFTSLMRAEKAISEGKIAFPLFVKPRWGSASMQLFRVHTLEELRLAFNLARVQLQKTFLKVQEDVVGECIMIQESLPGEEYGIDVLNDLDGQVQSIYVKRKLGMRAGETEKSELVDIPVLASIGEKIGSNLKHIGNLDCDVFYDGNTASVLELNPRFGGGYPFSHVLGANYPNAILHWYQNDLFSRKEFSRYTGQIVCKHDNLMIIKN